MKQVSFYFNLVLGMSNMDTENRNYATGVGNLFGKSCFPQFPLLQWQRLTRKLGNGEPVLNSMAGGGGGAGWPGWTCWPYIIIFIYYYKI